ncbi:MAG: SH3 domain-containing protein [Butyrivibrio sp.]|nr:SH3 domain-containing protein [Butyrivibrio sp.]
MKHNSRIFIALFAFFVIVALGALFMLNGSSSVFSRDAKSIGATTAVMSQTVVGDEPVVEATLPEENQQEEAKEEVPEETAEEADSAGADSGADSGEGAGAERAKRYITFKTTNSYTVLRLREAPSESAKILHKMPYKTPGYILKPGNTWCKVVLETGAVGYFATEYLGMTEVTAEDYPEEYRDMVEAPDEDLDF